MSVTYWYVSSTAYAALPAWAASHAYADGAIVRRATVGGFGLERVYRCEGGGTSGATEPTWDTFNGSVTADGTCSWRNVTGQSAYGWGAASATLNGTKDRYGSDFEDVYFVSSDHNEYRSDGSDMDLQVPGKWMYPGKIISVNRGGSVPPVGTDYVAGAITRTTKTMLISNWQIPASDTFVGFTFRSDYQIQAGTYICQHQYENCRFEITSNLAQTRAILSGGLDCGDVFHNCVFKYADVLQTFFMQSGEIIVRGGSIDNAVASPNIAFHLDGANFTIENFDFTNMAAGQACIQSGAQGIGHMINCTVPAGVYEVIYGNIDEGASQTGPAGWVIVERNDGTYAKYHNFGIEDTDAVIVRSGGASTSRRTVLRVPAVNSYTATAEIPMRSLPMVHLSVGGTETNTVHFITDAAAIPDNSQVFLDISYKGGTKNTALANPLSTPTAATADTGSSWSGPARANSHAYAATDIIANPSNAGQLLVCTTAGTSAGSAPGGYTGLTDGSSVTDGTAVFRAMVRFKVSKTLTSPNPLAGGTKVTVCLGANNGWRVWFDGKVEVT
jgi:hypothetical protein